MNGIKTEKLNIGYRSDLITDICLAVKPGSIVTLIGQNGCGKTTLLKTLTGELKDRGGLITLNGDDRSQLPANEIAKRMSMVMTQRIRPELMTCREVVEIGRYPYTGRLGILSGEDKEKVTEAMKWTDVDDLGDTLFDNISDGQKQRVLLARAICQEPKILILDEPISYLDIRHKIDILQRIMDFAKEKQVAILMSLHELEVARRVSDVVVALGEGKVLKIGTPDEVFTEDFIRKLYHVENVSTELLGSMPWTTKASPSGTITPRGKARPIMIQGTMSNVGKSVIAAGLCRIFSDAGYRVAPFKSQNMALNSYITRDGLEMGRAQVMQAECARMEPDVSMNPLLLKPTGDTGSQVIVNGKVIGNMTAAEYFRRRTDFIGDILQAYDALSENADVIVIEGAGSPVEMNLKQNDLVNMGLAKMLGAPVLIVGDIDRGGVFAQLLGTLDLLTDDERQLVKGFIVNKFRGDRRLFEDGVRILEEKGATKVAGVVPYADLRLDDEDSLTDRFDRQAVDRFDIAVIKAAHISNFTDFNPFEQLGGVSVRYITKASELGDPDLIILPGSKNTIADLRLLKENGLADAVVTRVAQGTCIFGICGGYQMLGKKVEDPLCVEGGGDIEGLGLLPVTTVLESEKTRTNVKRTIVGATGILSGIEGVTAEGYEIHMGKTTPYEDITAFTSEQTGYCRGNIYGTYLHGFFDKKEVLCGVVEKIAKERGKTVSAENITDYAVFKDRQYDLLAATLRDNLDMDYIFEIMGLKHDG